MPHWNFKKAVNETCFIQLVYSLVRVSSAKITVQSLESRRFRTAFHTKKTTNCVWKIKWELHENALECGCITSLWRYWHCPRGMRSRVYVTIGCPSVRLFGPSFNRRCGVRRVCCRAPRGQNTSIDSGGSQRPAARRSAANAGSVLLTAELARLNTDLFYGIAAPWMSYENKQYSEI